jgi:hypothetical protein
LEFVQAVCDFEFVHHSGCWGRFSSFQI